MGVGSERASGEEKGFWEGGIGIAFGIEVELELACKAMAVDLLSRAIMEHQRQQQQQQQEQQFEQRQQQHLDFYAPLISVRRQHLGLGLHLEEDNFASARNSDVGSEADWEAEAAGGGFGVGSPGAVPFFWERAPGVAKPEVAASAAGHGNGGEIGPLRPPPATAAAAYGYAARGCPSPGAPATLHQHQQAQQQRQREEEEEARRKKKKAEEEGRGGAGGIVRHADLLEDHQRNLNQDEEEEEEDDVYDWRRTSAAIMTKTGSSRSRSRDRGRASSSSPARRRLPHLQQHQHQEPAMAEVASTRAFAERVASRPFFGDLALRVISERAASPSRGRRALHHHQQQQHEQPPQLFQQQQPQQASSSSEDTDSAADEYADAQPDRDHQPAPRAGVPAAVLAAAAAARSAAAAAAAAAEEAGKQEDEEEDAASDIVAASRMGGLGCGLLPRVMGRAAPCFSFTKPSSKTRSSKPSKGGDRKGAPRQHQKQAVAGKAQTAPPPPPAPARQTRSSFPAGSGHFDNVSEFDDAFSEFWNEEEEEAFLDRRLSEVREAGGTRLPRSPLPGTGGGGGGDKDSSASSLTYTTSTHSGSASTSPDYAHDPGGTHHGNQPPRRSTTTTTTTTASTATTSANTGSPLPVYYDARGFLGVPARTPDSDLVPTRRAAAYRHYFHQDQPPQPQQQQQVKLEEFLRVERGNRGHGILDVQSWINHNPTVPHTAAMLQYTHAAAAADRDRAHSSGRSSAGDTSSFDVFSDSDGLGVTGGGGAAHKSSETTSSGSGGDASTDASGGDHDDVKGWPLRASGDSKDAATAAAAGGGLQLVRAAPPVPPSPSESWVWANLVPSSAHASAAAAAAQKKGFHHSANGGGGRPAEQHKWQIMVQAGNSAVPAADRLRCSEEFAQLALASSATTY